MKNIKAFESFETTNELFSSKKKTSNEDNDIAENILSKIKSMDLIPFYANGEFSFKIGTVPVVCKQNLAKILDDVDFSLIVDGERMDCDQELIKKIHDLVKSKYSSGSRSRKSIPTGSKKDSIRKKLSM